MVDSRNALWIKLPLLTQKLAADKLNASKKGHRCERLYTLYAYLCYRLHVKHASATPCRKRSFAPQCGHAPPPLSRPLPLLLPPP